MPTKKRLDKEREKKKMEEAIAVLPEHLVGADMSLNEAVIEAARSYNTNLVKFDVNGAPYRVVLHPEKPSNDKTAAERRAVAAQLKEKYPQKWGERTWAKWIAGEEGLGTRTIQKYFKAFP